MQAGCVKKRQIPFVKIESAYAQAATGTYISYKSISNLIVVLHVCSLLS